MIQLNVLQIKNIISDRCELTVHYKKNRFYLKKNFREKFMHEVEISLNETNSGELIIIEKGTGNSRSTYYSKENMRKLQEVLECEENMRFVFFKDKGQNIWKGILLPELKKSGLWKKTENTIMLDENDSAVNWRMFTDYFEQKYRGLIEKEEVAEYCRLGYLIADSVYSCLEKHFKECVVLCMWSLLEEIAGLERKCRKAEVKISCDQKIGKGSSYCYKDLWGICDMGFHNIEIEEFRSKLTVVETAVLDILQDTEWKYQIAQANGSKKFIWLIREDLKKKAYEYYGRDYIESYWKE